MRTLFCLLLVAASTALPAQTPAAPKPPAADTAKVGTYDLELTTDDGTLTGVLTIKRVQGKLAAELSAGGHSPAVQSFGRDGNAYVLKGGHDDFTVVYTFTFKRDSVSGNFKMSSGLSGTVLGVLRR